MITKSISERITNYLIKKSVIDNDSREIYQFGFEQLCMSTINIATVLLLGLILGEIIKAVVLTIAFTALRAYSGGFHASTPTRCYVLTVATMTISLSTMKYISINNFVYLGSLIFSSIIMIAFAPVGTENKLLDDIETSVYKKRTMTVWLIEILILLIFMPIESTISECIIIAQFIEAVSVISGKIVLRKYNKKLPQPVQSKVC